MVVLGEKNCDFYNSVQFEFLSFESIVHIFLKSKNDSELSLAMLKFPLFH